MRSTFLLIAASVASASAEPLSTIPRDLAPNLPVSSFPGMNKTPFSEAVNIFESILSDVGLDTEAQPGTKTPSDAQVAGPAVSAATSSTAQTAQTAQTADAAACAANPNVRFEWRDYSDSDRVALMAAINCLIDLPPSGDFPAATNRYEDLAAHHQILTPTIHNNAIFTAWHRYFLWTFEQVLRDECGFDRAMVWWDETVDAGNFESADLFTNTAYFGALPTADSNGNTVCITDGAFAGLTCHVGPGDSNTDHCLSRAVTESDTAQCSLDYFTLCNGQTDYATYETCIEDGYVVRLL
jgi:tyrosinase